MYHTGLEICLIYLSTIEFWFQVSSQLQVFIFNSTLHSTGSTIASLSVRYCILSKQQQQPKVLLDRFQSEPLQFKFSQWVEVDFKFKWSLISCVIFRTDQNRSPWRRSNQNQNQRRKLWSSRNGAIHSTLCTYRTQFGQWTESWLKRTSVTSCDQCWWQQWEWNLWRILICHFAMSYNGTGNQDGGSCGWQWAPKGILSRVKRLNWICFAQTAKQKLRFGSKACTATSSPAGITAWWMILRLLSICHGPAMPTSSLNSRKINLNEHFSMVQLVTDR